jgi:hypothetical protein
MPSPARKGRRRLESTRRSPASWAAIAIAPAVVIAGTWITADVVASNGDQPAVVSDPPADVPFTPTATTAEPAETSASSSESPSTSLTSSPGAITTPTGGPVLGPRVNQKQRVVQGRTIKPYSAAELAAIAEQEAMAAAARNPVSFRIGTFNVLGSNHTAPGGDRRAYPPASVRSPRAAAKIREHGVAVLGTQELKSDQLSALKSMTGMAAYPDLAFGTRDTDNNILYDPDVFEFVSGSSFTIRFMNSSRLQPILRLRHRATGREMYFINMHASAGGGQYAVSRAAGHNAVVSVVNSLEDEGLPIFLTGDMNDREAFFCRVAPPTGLVAAIGGSTAGGCSPAGALAVDWVLGYGATFADYWEDRSTLGVVSDHHFVSAAATIPAAG